mmetsp:Transcript_638/g.1404  ORF Transcript_638/g.1404 Transcript_638/m.1404 type:complete len:89 (+) Transcript_638:506-772(+)
MHGSSLSVEGHLQMTKIARNSVGREETRCVELTFLASSEPETPCWMRRCMRCSLTQPTWRTQPILFALRALRKKQGEKLCNRNDTTIN